MEENSIPDKLRSSRFHMFFKIGVFKNFANLTGKHQCWRLFFLSKFNNKNRKSIVRNVSNVKLKINVVKLNFYKCVHFLLFLLFSTLWIYHFHCFLISFLLLYLISTLIFYITTLIFRIFAFPPRFQRKILRK